MTKPDTDKTAESPSVDALLAQAAAQPERPSDAFFSKVLMEAQAVQPRVVPVRRKSLWQGISDALGGWRAMGGLAAAACAGLWIGVSAPAGLPDASVLIYGGQAISEADDISDMILSDWSLEEGFDDAG